MGVFEVAGQLAENPLTSNLVYDAVLICWKYILSIFFREIRPRGAFHIPRDGPVIFAVAPHSNQVGALARISLLQIVHGRVRGTVSRLLCGNPGVPRNGEKSAAAGSCEEHEARDGRLLCEVAA